jgi:hypothetical protein
MLTALVEVFVDWLYTLTLPKWNDVRAPVESNKVSKAHSYIPMAQEMAWTKAYIFGDRFQSMEFKKAVHWRLLNNFIGTEHTPFPPVVVHAFANLPDNDILLKLLVDAFCLSFKPNSDTTVESEHFKYIPHDFFSRVINRYSRVIRLKISNNPLNLGDYPLAEGK